VSKLFIQEIGRNCIDIDTWRVETDNNYTYLVRKAVNQKIKITDSLVDVMKKYEKDRKRILYITYEGKAAKSLTYSYDTGKKFLLLNNAKSMNLVMYQPKGLTENSDAYIVTFSEGYQLLTYQLDENAEIRYSYHNQELAGAVITFDSQLPEFADGSTPIIKMQCRKITKDGTVSYTELVSAIDNGALTTWEYVIEEKSKLMLFKSVEKRYPGGVGFKMKVNSPVTGVYVTVQEKVAELTELLSHSRVREPMIYTVTNPDDPKEAEKLLVKLQTENGVRAITEYGMQIDSSVIRTARILYVFILDETGYLKCIKSK
jgi:hypothetical protein